MAQLVALPDQRKPSSNTKPNAWFVHNGTFKWTGDSRSEVGKITTSTGHGFQANHNVGVQGSIYASSKGFSARVNSKNEQDYNTYHYLGMAGGLTLSDLKPGQTASGSNKACYLRDVTGFFCEVNGKPTIDGDYGGTGDAANDNCGRAKNLRVFGIYIDSNKKTHIYQMTDRGRKVQSNWLDWNKELPNSWVQFGYLLPSSDAQQVIDKKLMLMAWVVAFTHKKVCGNKAKNMTGRIRYMTPLITSDPDSYSLQESGYPWQIAMRPDTTATAAAKGWDQSSPPPLYTK
jgi:phage anti-repressor protein